MQNQKNEAISLKVTEGLTVAVYPNSNHEFLMSTSDVARGYGIAETTIRRHIQNYAAEIVENKHFVRGVHNLNSDLRITPNKVFWTKRGIVRLGFFIRSERARLFRDWAEDLVLATLDGPAAPAPTKPAGRPRRINRLTPDRIIDLLSDVCLIENKELRERIAAKLKGGLEYGDR